MKLWSAGQPDKRPREEAEAPADEVQDDVGDDEEEEESEDSDFFDSDDGSAQIRDEAIDNMKDVLTKRMSMSSADAKAFIKRHVKLSIGGLKFSDVDDLDDVNMTATFTGIREAQDAAKEAGEPSKKKAKKPKKFVPPASLTAGFEYEKDRGYSWGHVKNNLAVKFTDGVGKWMTVFESQAVSEDAHEEIRKKFKLSKKALEEIRRSVFGDEWPAAVVLELIFAATAVEYHDNVSGLQLGSMASCIPHDMAWLAYNVRKAAGCPAAKDKDFKG